MELCHYGCGQKAKFIFKNGKLCCSKNHKQCPNKKESKHDYKNDKSHKKVNCKYCNKEFFYSNLKQHESSCYLKPENIRTCLNCRKILNGRDQKKYCSKKCFASHTHTTKKKKQSKETKRKISTSVKNISPTRSDALKKPVMIEIKCPICGNIKKIKTTAPGSFSKTKSCSKKCLSKLLSKKSIESGCGGYREGSGRSKSGYYKGVYCGSSYELIFLVYHLNIGSNIKRCKLKIPYTYNGQNHHYYPDFEIDNIIYEIKGFYNKIVDIKTNAVINAGYKIEVLYLKDLQPMLDCIKNKFKIKNIIKLYEQKTLLSSS